MLICVVWIVPHVAATYGSGMNGGRLSNSLLFSLRSRAYFMVAVSSVVKRLSEIGVGSFPALFIMLPIMSL